MERLVSSKAVPHPPVFYQDKSFRASTGSVIVHALLHKMIMKGKALPIVLTGCLVVLAACNICETPSPKPMTNTRKLVIGLIPEHNLFKQIDRYEPLISYLSEKTGTQITLTILPRYGNIVDNFVNKKMDGAFLGSFTYVLIHSKLGVQALARPESPEGKSTYCGLIFVRKDSGIRSCQDMRRKRFAFVDRATTAGFLVPLAYFQQCGVNYQTFLKESYFTGTHEDAIYDVLNKKADIGAAKSTVFYRLAESSAKIASELTLLHKSFEVPENALAFRNDLDASLREKFKAVLLNMHMDPQGAIVLKTFGAGRFIETTESDYRSLYQAAREIKLKLSTYNYRNDL